MRRLEPARWKGPASLQGVGHAAFNGVVGQDDHVGLALGFGGFALQHGVDGDVVLGQDGGDAGQHAGLVGDDEAQVEGGLHLVDRQHRVSVMASGWKAR